jgi:methylated-DNA-[protein]-cysteine S-methyltransferase
MKKNLVMMNNLFMSTETDVSIAYYKSPAGILRLEATDSALTVVSFENDTTVINPISTNHSILQRTISQLDEYFAGTRMSFDIQLSPQGTGFQQSVWNELLKINYGVAITYLQLAKRLGNVKSIRAAASANGRNPLGIIIPCHRVVGADGKLTGYAGGLHRKQWLLEHEAKYAGQPSLF